MYNSAIRYYGWLSQHCTSTTCSRMTAGQRYSKVVDIVVLISSLDTSLNGPMVKDSMCPDLHQHLIMR